jgi:hypothetical protein
VSAGPTLWTSESFEAWLKKRHLTPEQVRKRDREYGFVPLTAKESGRAVKQSDAIGETVEMTLRGADGKPIPHKRYCLIDEEARERTGKKYTQLSKEQGGADGAILGVWHPKKTKKKKANRVIRFAEGEHKAWDLFEAADEKDIVVSVPGVQCFFKDGELHPTITALGLREGDLAKFYYDTDQYKPEIMAPLLQAAHAIHALGAKVQVCDLRPVPNLKKTGADDVRAEYGDEALVNSTAHDFPESEWADNQIKRLAKLGDAGSTLPDFSVAPIPNDWLDKKPPPPEYLIDGYLRRSILALIYGIPSAGKGFFALEMAMAIAGGVAWCRHETSQGRVVMLNFEEPAEILRERVKAIYDARVADLRIKNKIGDKIRDPREVENQIARYKEGLRQNLVVVSISGAQLHLIGMKDGAISQTVALGQLIAKLEVDGIIALFLDPMARLHGLEENSNPVATALVNACERIAAALKANVFLIHHTSKGDDESEHIYGPRGGSGLPAGVRFQLLLRMATKKDVETLKDISVAAAESGDILKLVNNKNSWGRKQAPMWFHRSENDGTLSAIAAPTPKDEATVIEELLTCMKKWEEKNGHFTRSAVTRGKAADLAKIYGRKFTKDKAAKFFDTARSAGRIKLMSGESGLGGGERFTVAGGGAS